MKYFGQVYAVIFKQQSTHLNNANLSVFCKYFFKIRLLLCIFILGQITACSSVNTLAEDYQAPQPLPKKYLAEFCYEPSPISEKSDLVKQNSKYDLYEVTIDVSLNEFDDDSIITFDFYDQVSESPSPVVVLLPILNGKKHLMRPFASHFANNGYSVIIIDTLQGSTLLEDLKDPEPSIRNAVQRHRRVIDWAENRDDIDISRLGVFGVSLGGFNALYLSALDKRVAVASIALAGGSLPEILVNSDERRVAKAVDEIKNELSLNDEQLKEYLTNKIVSDILVIAPHVNAERMLMVLAKYDKSVPYSNQLDLYNAMGQPEAVTLPTGHNSAAMYIFSFRQRVLEFFDKKLTEQSGAGTAAISPDYC